MDAAGGWQDPLRPGRYNLARCIDRGFLCMRATCRASEHYLRGLRIAPGISGLHRQTKLAMAPPKGPRKEKMEVQKSRDQRSRRKVCKYGASCYRSNLRRSLRAIHSMAF